MQLHYFILFTNSLRSLLWFNFNLELVVRLDFFRLLKTLLWLMDSNLFSFVFFLLRIVLCIVSIDNWIDDLYRLRSQSLKDYHIELVTNGKLIVAHWNSYANWDPVNSVMFGKVFGIIQRQLRLKHSNLVSKCLSITSWKEWENTELFPKIDFRIPQQMNKTPIYSCT